MPERRTRTAMRIAGFYVVSFAIVSLIVGAATWRLTGNAFRHTLDDRLRDELVALEHADEREGREALIADIVAFDAIPGNGRYLLDGPDGRRLAGRVSVTGLPDDIGDTMLRAVDGHMEPARVVKTTLQDGSTLAVVGETAAMDRTERTLLLIAAVGFGLVIVIGAIGGILSGRALHRRLSVLGGTAQAIINGDLTRRMPISAANDEFDQLSTTLNQMLDHIGRLMNSLRHVSADIAHDLRSPLTRLRARLEAALHSSDPTEQAEGIADALDRTDEILGLFATMLRISEVDAGGVKQWFRPVALVPLINEIVENYRPAAEDSCHQLETGALDDLTVNGSEDLIGQIVANLIENGLRHTPAGSRIIVALERTVDGAAELSVRDDGPGIPETQHALALQRFGRGELSRARPGHGLGLAMVQSIATAHGAQLILDDARPGLAVRVLFPLEG